LLDRWRNWSKKSSNSKQRYREIHTWQPPAIQRYMACYESLVYLQVSNSLLGPHEMHVASGTYGVWGKEKQSSTYSFHSPARGAEESSEYQRRYLSSPGHGHGG